MKRKIFKIIIFAILVLILNINCLTYGHVQRITEYLVHYRTISYYSNPFLNQFNTTNYELLPILNHPSRSVYSEFNKGISYELNSNGSKFTLNTLNNPNQKPRSKSSDLRVREGNLITIDMDLPKDWSMISLPVNPYNANVSELFHDAVVVYGYKKGVGYVRIRNVEDLEVKKGYWILLDNQKTYSLTGQPIHGYTLYLNEDGWYMIGGCSYPAKASVESGKIVVIYRYVQGIGYKRVWGSDNLETGNGYWICLSEASNLDVKIIPPIADAGPDQEVPVGTIAYLDGSKSTQFTGGSLTYYWTLISLPYGSNTILTDTNSRTPSLQPDHPGIYLIRLIVNDGIMDSLPDTVAITAIVPNSDPVADPDGPYNGSVGHEVCFDGLGSSDPDGDPLTYEWDFGDSTTGTGKKPCHIYSVAGTYAVILTVEDKRGGIHSAQTTTKIAESAYVPTITDINPKEGPVGETVTIYGTNFDKGGLNVSFDNGVNAVVAGFTSSSITIIVPLGAETGPLKVMTSEGIVTSIQDFVVTPLHDFYISASPQQATISPGGQIGYTISVSGTDGFSSMVTLDISGLPEGASGYFSPKSLTSGLSSTLTINACNCDKSGQAALTISGSAVIEDKTVTKNTTVDLEILSLGTTTLTGRVLNTEEEPLKEVTIKVEDLSTTTDESGNFLIENPPTGEHVVLIDGFTASTDTAKYPTIPITMEIMAGQTNSLPFIPHLHAQKNYNFTPINPYKETKVEDPDLPGFQMRIPPGVDIIGWDGETNTKVSARKVPLDALPVLPPPPEVQPKSVYMFYFGKRGGGTPTIPIPVTLPNDLGLGPGEKAELWYFNESPNIDEAPNEWSRAGTGTVSSDGRTITTDPGVGIPRFCCGAIIWSPDEPTGPEINPENTTDGDPVDLATGVFVLNETDMIIRDRIPIVITRTYRTLDEFRGAYGIGTYYNHDWYLLRSGDVATLVIPPGSRIRFSRQNDGTFINNTDPSYLGARAAFNTDGTSILRMKDGTTYKFDINGLLVEHIDRNGNKLKFLREVEGNVTKIIGTDGRILVNFHIRILGRDVVTEMWDITGRKVIYNYNYSADPGTGRLMSVTDPKGGLTRYEYDDQGRMTAVIAPMGNVITRNTYDINGRVCQQEQADGGIWKFYYITADKATTPAAKQLLAEAASGGPITTPACSAIASGSTVVATIVVDPIGNPKTYRFDGKGFLVGITNALGQTTTYKRANPTNLLLSATDPMGRITSFEYDSFGNITSVTDPNRNTISFEYEPNFSRLRKITDPLENISSMEYDSKGNLIEIVDPMDNSINLSYDQYGQPVSITDPLGNTTEFEYDESGNLSATIDPIGNRTSRFYDVLSRLVKITNPLGRSTSFIYDPLDNLIEIIDPLGRNTKFSYDLNSNLITLTDPNNRIIVTNIYNTSDRVSTSTDILGNIESYSYDYNGNLIKFADARGIETNYTYDPLDHLIRADYMDGGYSIYNYDAGGRLERAGDSISGSMEFYYDNLDQLVKKVTSRGTIHYAYDNLGRRTKMEVCGQEPVLYSYNDNGRLITIKQGIQEIDIDYDKAGRRSLLTLPNGITAEYEYDDTNRLTRIIYKLGTEVLKDLVYTYDAAGNRILYSGSLTSLPEEAIATYNNANQILTFNNMTFTYDERGNTISQSYPNGTINYSWDTRNRLVGITGPGLTANFVYDSFGNRIRKEINGRAVDYLYDGSDIVQEIENGAVTANYLNSLYIDEPFALTGFNGMGPQNTNFYLADGLGSIIAMADEVGEIATQYGYEPFGKTTSSGQVNPNPFQFTGRENDNLTGLYYYRARYYNPAIGRFLQPDPIGFWGWDINLYRYVTNNPVNFIDPKGLWGVGIIGSGSVEAGLVVIGAGATGSIGGGVFGGGEQGTNLGGFASFGAFAGGPGYGPSYPDGNGGVVGGAYAGVGGGAFITNAKSAKQLSGPFDTYSFNLGVGPISVSVQVGVSNGTWIGSATFGPGIGVSGSGYQTNTWTTK